ncbi:DUF3710 domain-containing protein [Parenemella sanctibonifatiensis]|uniref:DUF3710 domain-containing protein n=1 Tax=Parenemella sanctibonifatiensis TaxID=2016505 RepID=A0A255EHY4_9ACTN|nr:DUF3710 domain-containing protein [Parenemella sanctibonifatiensis]OYN91134.1 hypothetical protein CGZ91_06650 [Parenemella sanctibonifatiensis]
MIFGRKRGKKKSDEDPIEDEVLDTEADEDDAEDEEDDDLDQADADDADEDDTDDDSDADDDSDDPDFDELDKQDWRADGPFDFAEVDLENDPVERMDFGGMIITPFEGMKLQLHADPQTQQIQRAMVMHDDSVLELSAYAAPRARGYITEIRDELINNAKNQGGSANLVEGPFGTELKRLLPVRTPEGKNVIVPTRTWLVHGPRWVLRGIIMGKAAMEEGTPEELLECFHNVIVRRGDDPKAPGELLEFVLPDDVTVERN